MDNNIVKSRLKNNEMINSDLFYRSLFTFNPDMVFFADKEGIIAATNEGFTDALGYSKEEIALCPLEQIFIESEVPKFRNLFSNALSGKVEHVNTVLVQKNGDPLLVDFYLIPAISYKNTIGIFGLAKDITERKKTEDLNNYLVYHDPLTKLPNRRFLNEKLEQEIVISKTLQKQFALMILNLDRFKYVNDTLGHHIGDKLLKEFSFRLNEILGEEDILTRVDGDEFVILIRNILDTERVIAFAKMMINSIEKPFCIHNYEIFVSTSVGISFFPIDGEDYETIVKHANSALYKAKSKGNNTYQIYTSSLDAVTYKSFRLETDLRKALKLNQFEMYYQPKINPNNNLIIGAEALIRWNHPEWGIVYPNEFIPLAEETGLIIEMGKWIKETVCIQNKRWQDEGLPAIPISINLSAHRFLEKELLVDISEILEKTKLAPEYLEVEILESFLLENENSILSMLDELKRMGIRVSLDDFGTGYSSLSYLKKFKGRIDTLKIDRAFINDLSRTDSESTNFITKTIIDLAHHLKMDVVAEGVETREQLEILMELNCNVIQGYLYSKPVNADEFTILLQNSKIIIEEANEEENEITNNRREYFRINFDIPLIASMTLTSIHGRKVELGKAEVIVEDIGAGGLRFLSDIRLTVHRNIILEFETEILGNNVIMQGVIVWMNEMKYESYQYGVEFLFDNDDRSDLTQILNKLAIVLRKNPLPSDTSFVKVDKNNFFKAKNKV
ncbi:EAL domain-containing protein [Bacillus sp. JJ1521]|uniref:EAL domain-containing protein n=1 Tax=Bacillus sp. JJ1521 TaxID=3122957 RepID=UPI0030004C2C